MGRIASVPDALSRVAWWIRRTLLRSTWWCSTDTGFAALFGAGLAIRLILASGSAGFPYDTSTFAAWAARLAQTGPGLFYPGAGEEFFADYPPGYLYVLYGLGKLSGGAPGAFLLKLPGILADLACAWAVVVLASRLTPDIIKRRFPLRGAAAATVLLNPAIVFVSSIWGQVDSVLASLVLAAAVLLGTGARTLRREAAGMAVLAAALATKPQAAFVIPAVVLVLVFRHVRRALAEREDVPTGAAAPLLSGAGRLVVLIAAATLAGFALLWPFGLGPGGAWDFYTQATRTYQVTSVFAFNLWGAIGFWKPDVGAQAVRVAGVPALSLGLIAFGAAAAAVLLRAWRSLERGVSEGRVLVFGGAALTCAAFALLTRIHERYLFLALALLAPFVAYRSLRRVFVGLSVLYLVNVYFPYAYYVVVEKRPRPVIDPLFSWLYGSGLAGGNGRGRFLSLLTAGLCLVVAWRGWGWIERRPEAAATEEDETTPPAEPEPAAVEGEPLEGPPKRWELSLHPVGRRGAALALAVFVAVLASRLVDGSPRGMYFDEVYHARTAGEYLQRKDVYEWTHPPLAKELMAVSISRLSSLGVTGRGAAPFARGDVLAAADAGRVSWAHPDKGGGIVRRGTLGVDCSVVARGSGSRGDVRPSAVAVAVAGDVTYLGGEGPEGGVLVRLDGDREAWRVPMPAVPTQIALLGETVFAVGRDGSLVRVRADGGPQRLLGTDGLPVSGVSHVAAATGGTGAVWASIPGPRVVKSWNAEGAPQAEVALDVEPGPLVAPRGSDRLLVAATGSRRIVSVDTGSNQRSDGIDATAEMFVGLDDVGLVWALEGSRLRLIEPRGMAVLGGVNLDRSPDIVVRGSEAGRLLAVAGDEATCVSGSPDRAWRLGSAITGAIMAAFVFLIALRLFGSAGLAGLAALFLAVDGLAFVMARIAMNDSYITAFLLGAWFCALSALHAVRTGDDTLGAPAGRWAAVGWLAGTGVLAGGALASKWVAVYGLVGIGVLLVWDGMVRGRRGIWGLAGRPATTLAVFALLLGALPFGVYVASYVPYFRLGHGFGVPRQLFPAAGSATADTFFGLQRAMFDYHAKLTATHPYGSPWYGWPFGYRPVFLYLGDGSGRSAEIWTAGNPVVFLGGLAAFAAAGFTALRRRLVAPAVVLLAAAVQYLPWIAVSRVTFLYHYLPVVPFLAIGLAWWISQGPWIAEARRRVVRRAVAGAAVAAFALMLPMLDGWFVPSWYLTAVRSALPWMFP